MGIRDHRGSNRYRLSKAFRRKDIAHADGLFGYATGKNQQIFDGQQKIQVMKINLTNILLIAAVVMLGIMLMRSCGGKQMVTGGAEIRQIDSLLTVFRDSSSARFTVLEQRVSSGATGKQMEDLSKKLADINIKLKNVDRAVKILLESQDTFETNIIPVQTDKEELNYLNASIEELKERFNGLTTEYNIPFKNKNLTMNTKFNILDGKASGSYHYTATLFEVSHWEKKLFKRDRLLLTLDIDDPNATLSTQSFNFDTPKNVVDVGFIGGYGLGMSGGVVKPMPFIGIGLSKRAFSINLRNKKF